LNTFLPYSDFAASARCLDNARLGKQRVEVLQLVNTLKGKSTGWRNHPCIKMWRDFPDALIQYGVAICDEWTSRGFKDTVREKLLSMSSVAQTSSIPMPQWLGRESFHASHRANLLRKDPLWYGKFGWTDCPLLYYEWPT
jgi:hypothetical protein